MVDITPLPVPRITAPNWGAQLNNAITSRYLKALELINAADDSIPALIAAELASYQPGLEIAYGERTTTATSTQTAPNATGTISGLTSGVVTGAGRPVDVRFECALAFNSVANKHCFASLMVNGGAGGSAGATHSPVTTTGIGFSFTRRMVLTDAVDYTFTVALYTESGGGTVSAFANSTYPMSISVTNR